MKLSYFRKTQLSTAQAVGRLKHELTKREFVLLGSHELPDATLISFIKPKWVTEVAANDRDILGLVPNMVFVLQKDGAIFIGILNPDLLSGGHPGLASFGADMNRELRNIIDETAGVGPRKVEAVTLYSTATCPYCMMEKEYLEKHKIPFTLKMVDADHKAADEMVRKTGQMGVPATEIRFDDGDDEIIVGFDKHRLNQFLMPAETKSKI